MSTNEDSADDRSVQSMGSCDQARTVNLRYAERGKK